MTLAQLLTKRLIEVVQWNEPEDGILAYRYPMLGMEIQNGGRLTVRESQIAAIVSDGKITDLLSSGVYSLTARNLPVLSDLMNWSKSSESPFKADVYFFSARLQNDQKWGTATPIALRDKEFGDVRLRCYGSYSYRIVDPRIFFTQIRTDRESFFAYDLEGQLCQAIVPHMAEILARGELSILDLTANQANVGNRLVELMQPVFSALGLALNQFTVDHISIPEDLQKQIDQRAAVTNAGEMGRAIQLASVDVLSLSPGSTPFPLPEGPGRPTHSAPSGLQDSKFCIDCGTPIPQRAKFCSECGQPQ